MVNREEVAIELRRRLRWADADLTGRLHFPRIFEIVEEAEAELLRELKWEVNSRKATHEFPRVHINCSFYRMIFHDDPFVVRLTVGHVGNTSIRYDFAVFDSNNELAIKGKMVVAVLKEGRVVTVPPDLRS